MMLRSSSTPLLSSLLPSAAFAESPNHHQPPSAAAADDRLSFPSPSPRPRLHVGFRRAQSEGNLEGLAAPQKRSAAVLDMIPFDTEDPGEGDVDEYDTGSGFAEGKAAMCCGFGGGEAPLFLARGLGIDGASGLSRLGGGDGGYAGGSGGGGGGYPTVTGYGGGRSDLEGFLKKMVEEHPSEALFLRNYAQFLCKEKKDVRKAEEYYSRAMLASPGDGEILMEYAKLIWAHHGDRERAGQYFEQAVQASPQDCHVLAEYAHFLWEEGEKEGDDPCDAYGGRAFSSGAVAEASA